MEPDVSVEGAARIRIVILQVGEMSSSTFRDYSSLIMHLRQVELSSASSFYKEEQKSPFAQLPWDTGQLRFRFILGGATRSPWEDFQAQRKVHGVIGICHCPNSPDLGEAYDDFLQACRAYPSAQAKRCFAFDPSDAQVEQHDKDRRHLILFPWAEPRKLAFQLAFFMQEFAATLLNAFENWVLHADPIGAVLTTPLDSQTVLAPDEAKKRRLGRIQKAIGDYCLLAGSPRDAHEHYLSGLELAKAGNDLLWHAGAQEGITSAIVVDTGEKNGALVEIVQKNYRQVMQLYQKTPAPVFELEATLKLARYVCNRETPKDCVELLSSALDSGRVLTDASDKLVLNFEVAKIFGQLGYARKAAFYARQAAHMYDQRSSRFAAVSALQVLALLAPSYKVESNATAETSGGDATNPNSIKKVESFGYSQSRREGLHGPAGGGDKGGAWATLQMDLLGELLAAAVRAGEPVSAWSAAARLLRGHYALLTPASQAAVAAALTAAAERLPAGMRGSDPCMPFVRVASIPGNVAAAQIVKRTPGREDWWNGPAGTGPFIYTPFSNRGGQEKEVAETFWVVGELVQVIVELANPCTFDVVIESITLSVTSEFEAYPLSLTLSACTPSHPISLAGVPRKAGLARIRGCFVRSFGMTVEHSFTQDGDEAGGKVETFADAFHPGGPVLLAPRPIPTLKVTVLPPLPLLHATLKDGVCAPVLFEGEVRDLTVMLTNCGAVPVTSAHVSLLGKNNDHVLFIGHEAVQKALPLVPGASVALPLRLQAQLKAAAGGDSAGPGGEGRRGGGGGGATGVGATGGAPGGGAPSTKEDASAILAVHYAGPDEASSPESEGAEKPTVPPGRRATLPLHLHVQRGLLVVRARLLAMGGPQGYASSVVPSPSVVFGAGSGAKSSSGKYAGGGGSGGGGGSIGGTGGPERSQSHGAEEGSSVPVREGKGLRLLELELWNGTDVTFDVAASIRATPGRGEEGSAEEGEMSTEAHSEVRRGGRSAACDDKTGDWMEEEEEGGKGEEVEGRRGRRLRRTRVDRECSARVLIPLEAFEANLVPPGPKPGETVRGKQFVLPRQVAGESAPSEHYEAAVEALCSRIRLRWQSGRNSRGVLPIRTAVREALRGPTSMEILLPDPVTFSFKAMPLQGAGEAEGGMMLPKVIARDMTPVELTVRNNTAHVLPMTLSVTCRDMTGASCVGQAGTKATVLWAGTLHDVLVKIPPWAEHVHAFSLSFLVPGEYTLLAAALVDEPAGPNKAPKRICCSGLTHRVFVGSPNYSSGGAQ
eukprot:TRINITY_DN11609_c0_g1_i1.p1 TRINITY_DN11609_c0_g1~~TRINITY_DN11609_c0_g1_i1.p1  ORF type:complete len:1279 (+),score=268.61 TRINITY_DN11609_c0_g1_i1:228-4064(+)